jgi:Ser/Thr protein kinase RdoA (MazF antagonist)
MLHETLPSSRQDRALGAFLARLGLALRTFRTPDPRAGHLWDLKQLPSSRELIAHLSDPQSRAHVETAYDDFEHHVARQLPSHRAQPIHNDMNPWNVVVDPVDPAVIDFGDMAQGPLVCDAAVGAAYRGSPNEHPLAGASRFLRGYAEVCPLVHEEVDLMLDLIRGRLAMILNIGNWQALCEPDNSSYALRLQAHVRQTLDRLLRVSRDEGRRLMHGAMEGLRHG